MRFNNFVIVPTRCEEIVLKAKAFRTRYSLSILRDRDGEVRINDIIHDWLHFELGLSDSDRDEALVAKAEYQILRSRTHACNISPSIVQQHRYAYANLFEIDRITKIVN